MTSDVPSPSVSVRDAAAADAPLMDRLMQLYLHDLSEVTGDEVDQDGRFPYRWLDAYWQESERMPFLLEVDGRTAGFALVRRENPIQMAEFFVLRRHRRSGVGKRAARELFDRVPGIWSITQLPGNAAATTFWRRAIPVPFEDVIHEDGRVEQVFTTGPAGGR